MSRSEAARGRWSLWIGRDPNVDEEEARQKLGVTDLVVNHSSMPRDEKLPVQVVPASSLSLALEALREIRDWKDEDWFSDPEVEMKKRARAVLDQLEEGERS